MKYNSQNYIRVFYDKWSGESSLGGTEYAIENHTEFEKIPKEEISRIQSYGESLVAAIEVSDKKFGGIKTFDTWKNVLKEKFKGTLPKNWNTLLLAIEIQLKYEKGEKAVYATDGKKLPMSKEKLLNTVKSVVGKIPVLEIKKEQPKEQKDENTKSKETFIKKYGSTENFKIEIEKFVLTHPVRAKDGVLVGGNILAEARSMIGKTGKEGLESYTAVLTTAENAVKSKVFQENIGNIQKIFNKLTFNNEENRRMSIFKGFFRDMLEEARKTGKVQSIDGFENKEVENLTKDEQKLLKDKTPDKLFRDFVSFLRGLNEQTGTNNKLEKSQVQAYIKGLTGSVSDLVKQKFPENSIIRKSYQQKIDQMNAIAEDDVLYDAWTQFKGKWSGNTIDSLISAVERSNGEMGGVGYDDDGNYQFYRIDEMKTTIMRGDNIDGTMDKAWDGYIKSTAGSIEKMKEIFKADGLDALYLYLKDNPKSMLIDSSIGSDFFTNLEKHYNNDSSNDFFLGKKKEASSNQEAPQWTQKVSLVDAFPGFVTDMNNADIKLNDVPPPLPTRDGRIDGPKLVMVLVEGKGLNGDKIQVVINAMRDEFKRKFDDHKKKIQEQVTELGKKYKDWSEIQKIYGIKSPLQIKNEKGISESFFLEGVLSTKNFTKEQANALLEIFEQKLESDGTLSDGQKKELKLITKLIRNKIDARDAETNAEATGYMRGNNVATSQGDPKAQLGMAETVNTAGEATVARRGQVEESKNTPKSKEFQTLFQENGLPSELDELAKPRYLGKINQLISILEGRVNTLDKAEREFLTNLQSARSLIHTEARAISVAHEFSQLYPEYSETISNIKSSNEVIRSALDNPNRSELEAYRYINAPYPLSETGMRIASEPIGGEPKLISSITQGKPISEFVGNGQVSRTGVAECSIDFGNSPTGRYLDKVEGIPLKGIDSFIIQSELYTKLGLHSLIPIIPDINREISKKSGKNTDFSDGKFDIEEVRRTLYTLAELLGVELLKDESIESLGEKILSTHNNSQKGVEKKLMELGIMKEEGGYNKMRLSEHIDGIYKKRDKNST